MAFTKKGTPSKNKPWLKPGTKTSFVPGTKKPYSPWFQKKFKGKGVK